MSCKIYSAQYASIEASQHNDPLQLKPRLAEEPLPGEDALELGLRRRHSLVLLCQAALPAPSHVPALQQHCSHSDKWPRLQGSWLQEPWHKSGLPAQGSDKLLDAAHQSCLPTPLPQQHSCLKAMSLKCCTVLCQRWAVTSAGGQAHSPEQEHLKLPTGQPTRTHLSVPLHWLGLNRAH